MRIRVPRRTDWIDRQEDLASGYVGWVLFVFAQNVFDGIDDQRMAGFLDGDLLAEPAMHFQFLLNGLTGGPTDRIVNILCFWRFHNI